MILNILANFELSFVVFCYKLDLQYPFWSHSLVENWIVISESADDVLSTNEEKTLLRLWNDFKRGTVNLIPAWGTECKKHNHFLQAVNIVLDFSYPHIYSRLCAHQYINELCTLIFHVLFVSAFAQFCFKQTDTNKQGLLVLVYQP